MFLLELEENQSTERQQTIFGNLVIFFPRATLVLSEPQKKAFFLESSKCITGYQIKDLLRVPLGLFFYETVCSILESW